MELNHPFISDDSMKQILGTVRSYMIVFLKSGSGPDHPDLQQIIWEHGIRNLEFRAKRINAHHLSINCRI